MIEINTYNDGLLGQKSYGKHIAGEKNSASITTQVFTESMLNDTHEHNRLAFVLNKFTIFQQLDQLMYDLEFDKYLYANCIHAQQYAIFELGMAQIHFYSMYSSLQNIIYNNEKGVTSFDNMGVEDILNYVFSEYNDFILMKCNLKSIKAEVRTISKNRKILIVAYTKQQQD